MALLAPTGGCQRLTLTTTAVNIRPRATGTMFAALSRPLPAAEKKVDWVEATNSFFERDSRPIMLFDGVCNLCNGGVRFVRQNDRNRRIRYEALQSEAGRNLLRRSGRAPDDISSVVLVEKDRSYIKSDAVLKIMECIDLPFPQLAFFLQFVPLFVRDFVYDNVADNRYTIFGRSESCESHKMVDCGDLDVTDFRWTPTGVSKDSSTWNHPRGLRILRPLDHAFCFQPAIDVPRLEPH